MFKIGDFAKLNKVTIKALHHYNELGILPPVKIDEHSGYRYYSASQIPRLHRILALKDLNFSLNDIAAILDNSHATSVVVTMLQQKEAQMRLELAAHQVKLNRLSHLLNQMQTEDDAQMLQYDIVIKNEEAKNVLSIRERLNDFAAQGELWNELISYLHENKAKINSPIAIYYDTTEDESAPNIEVAVVVTEKLPETKRIANRRLEAVNELACVIHKGKNDTLANAYAALQQWMEQNRYTITGPVREVHHEGYWTTPDPNEHVTEIQIPVAKEK